MKSLEQRIEEMADTEADKRYKESHSYGDTSHEERVAFGRGAQFGSAAMRDLLAEAGEGHGPLPRLWVQVLSAPFSKTPEAIHVRVVTQCKTEAMPGDWEYCSLSELLQARAAHAAAEARVRELEMRKCSFCISGDEIEALAESEKPC